MATAYDTRTDAERRYDAAQPSPLPTASAPAELPPVRETPFVSEPDAIDGSALTGMSYFAGSGDAEVECFFSSSTGPYNRPCVYMFARDGVDLELVLRVLPALQALASDARVQKRRARAPLPAESPAVTVTTWQGEVGTPYTDFSAGDGLTRVMIGTHVGTKDGIELIVGGACINEHSDEVLTLADVRQLRDNLDALLSDARLLAAVEL